MPIPLLVWGAAALIGYIGWRNRDKIAEFHDSDAGKEFLHKLNESAEEVTKAHYDKPTQQRMDRYLETLLRIDEVPAILGVPAYLRTIDKSDLGILAVYSDTMSQTVDDSTIKARLRSIAQTARALKK